MLEVIHVQRVIVVEGGIKMLLTYGCRERKEKEETVNQVVWYQPCSSGYGTVNQVGQSTLELLL